jgi:hypothetical protein
MGVPSEPLMVVFLVLASAKNRRWAHGSRNNSIWQALNRTLQNCGGAVRHFLRAKRRQPAGAKGG